MPARAKHHVKRALKWSEAYTKTDMAYLLHAGFWGNLNAIILTFLSFILYIAYAHFLTKDVYGTYQYLLSFFSIATAFTLTGMNTAVSRAVARGYEGTLRASIKMQLQWGVIPFLGAMAAAGYYFAHSNLLLAWGLIIIAVGTPLLYAFNTYGALFGGRKDFKHLTIYNTTSNVFYYSLLIAAAFFTRAPLFILGVNLGAQVLLSFILYRVTLRTQRPNSAIDQESLSYGLHLSFMYVFGSVAGQLGNIFVFHFLGAPTLALYSFASAMPERIGSICFKFLGPALLPKFSERSVEEVRRGLPRKMFFATMAGIVVAAGYLIVAAPMFHIFFPTYNSAIPYSYLIAFGLVLGASAYLPTTALTALKFTRALYIQSIIIPIIQIAFPLIGIYFGGLWGYIIAVLCTVLFALGFSTLLVYYSRE